MFFQDEQEREKALYRSLRTAYRARRKRDPRNFSSALDEAIVWLFFALLSAFAILGIINYLHS